MRTISVISLKGGVAKTTTSVNVAYLLAKEGNRVLLIDNDKQGNASKTFGVYDPEDKNTIARAMLEKDLVLQDIVKPTKYKNLHIITANMDLLTANMRVITDVGRQQQTRFKKAFENKNAEGQTTAEMYDYCIIDNAPDINMSIINALVISNDVIVPVEIDQYSFDGLEVLAEQIKQTKEDFNQNLNFTGCLVTKYKGREEVQEQGAELLARRFPVFNQRIRRTEKKPQESTFAQMPLVEYSVRCGASQDYKKFLSELYYEPEEAE